MGNISVKQDFLIDPQPGYSWIQLVSDTIERFGGGSEGQLHTDVQPCVIKGIPSVIYEKNLHESSSVLFHFVQNFASCNKLNLVEDQRSDRVEISHDRRQNWAPLVALGAGMMLRETRYKSASLVPSIPHELRSGEPAMEASEVVNLSARIRSEGLFTELESKGLLIANNCRRYSIRHYHMELNFRGGRREFSYFEGKIFHALGHLSGDQIVLNVLVGGGPFNAPRLWGPVERMARDPVNLHFLRGHGSRDGFGVFQVIYYLDAEG